jgi:hypothetical protein
MGKNESSDGGDGCGCVSLIITILVLTALWFGLPVGEKKWNIDIFPPRIWDMNADQNEKKEAEEKVEEKKDEF